ncbi:MAG: LemA family protein [Chitinophagaceae bacterium]
MQKKRYTGFIVGAILILLGLYIIVTYNSLVKKEEKVKRQWSEVQNTYQRRLDLVPNLVNVVKGVSEFEQTTLENIAAARSKALSVQTDDITADNYNRQRELQDSLASATNRLVVIIEKYPSLKGTSAYSGLQTQLEGTERRIKIARNDFNESVADYNTTVRGGSSMLVAKLFGFKPKDGFQSVPGSDKAVEIKF